MKYIATLNGKKYEVELEKVNTGYAPMSYTQAAAPMAPVAPVQAAPVAAPAPVAAAPAPVASTGGETVLSPLPGTILDIKVAAGQSVSEGDVVIIMEAMKMETEVVATASGVIESIVVKKGDLVDTDAALVVIK